MKYVDEFRSPELIQRLAQAIHQEANGQEMVLMEVCGTHTMNIARFGLRELLPKSIRLISGPGCPVCVTPHRIMDHAIALSRKEEVILAIFGDMLRVPGSSSSLEKERSQGADVRVVSSTLDALRLAQKNPHKKVVFVGVGFETTAPTVAVSILEAHRSGVTNYYVLSAHKVMPPALRFLSTGPDKPDGYILPGHVSAIIGTSFYQALVQEYRVACAVAGFEPVDILEGILMLVKQIHSSAPKVDIAYRRAISSEGNPTALKILDTVFEPCDSEWRGLGFIPKSGLKIREAFSMHDAEKQIPVEVEETKEPTGCLCGEVLKGKILPPECPLFGSQCTPENPIGACMVSSEGTCAAYFRYGV